VGFYVKNFFSKVASWTSKATGKPAGFIIALAVVLVWAITGPIFRFSDTWQLVINTGTTIVTFLMVFLIQNSQNRDTAAMQLKLDEIIRSKVGAKNKMLDIEEMSYEDLEKMRAMYEKMACDARQKEEGQGKEDTGICEGEGQQEKKERRSRRADKPKRKSA